MGSQITYKNDIINHTFDPLFAPLIFLVSLLILIGSIIFFCISKKKGKPIPEASDSKKEIKTTVKSDKSMKTQYSDEHLVVTSNMKERLKMFDKNVK